MECNKEEAVRAKGIAEQKMQIGDFEAAKKFALRAQKLFPDVENISQLLAVCDVHCRAKQKLYGTEMNWYGILQIEHTADESSIKKQFRKLALLLHPDKNKYHGAEAAFKLIGEANMILTDQQKRSHYDAKCRFSVKTAPKPTTQPSKMASSVTTQNRSTNNYQHVPPIFTTSHACQYPQHLVFWTRCSACKVRYQYHKGFVNRMLRCPTCGSAFLARDLGPQVMSPGSTWSPFSNHNGVLNQGPCKVSSQSNGDKPSGFQFSHIFARSNPIPKAGSSVQVGDSTKEVKVSAQMRQPHEGSSSQQRVDGLSNGRGGGKGVEMPKPNAAKRKASGTSRNAKKKRGRNSVEESSESIESDSDSEVVFEACQKGCGNSAGLKSSLNGFPQHRRSSRQKQNVSYEEKMSDEDDFVSPPAKGSKATTPTDSNAKKVDDNVSKRDNPMDPAAAAAADVCCKEVKQKASAPPEGNTANKKSKTGESKTMEEKPVISDNNNEMSQVDSGSQGGANVNPCPQVLHCPDPEFADFEKYRAENCFAVNQVWAIYDTLDGMPRFYARVKRVFTSGFKLRITWLEPHPDGENETNWADLELPVSCGKYCNGASQECEDRLMFSHRVDHIKSVGRCRFVVHPQKGETWALFRDWDMKWVSEPEKHKSQYQYDFVEVLTDFDEETGVGVVYLGKVKGFVSIFQQTERDGVISFQVSPQELYRFSHQIPSCKMTGKEREGVPVGSFELDPAALPMNLFELVGPGDSKVDNHNLDGEAKATIDSKQNFPPTKNDNVKEVSPFRRSTRGSSCMPKYHGQVDAGQYKEDYINDKPDSNFNQPRESSTSGGTGDKMINTPKRCTKNGLITDFLKPRRSPRDLSRKGSQVTANGHGQADAVQGNDGISVKCNPTSTLPKERSTSDGLEEQKIKTPNKCKKNDLATDSLKPQRLPKDLSRKGSQINANQKDQVDAGQHKEDDSSSDMCNLNSALPKESSTTGGAADQMIKTPSKCKRNDIATDCLKPRRSPRDLYKKALR